MKILPRHHFETRLKSAFIRAEIKRRAMENAEYVEIRNPANSFLHELLIDWFRGEYGITADPSNVAYINTQLIMEAIL